MSNRWKYLVFVLSIASAPISAQTNATHVPGFTADILQIKTIPHKRLIFPVGLNLILPEKKVSGILVPLNKVEPFFCKLESGLEKKSGMPIRIRLGSIDYVDYLEGKTH